MRIDDVEFNASLEEILDELVRQLRINNIQYLQKMKPTGNDIQVCCPYHADGMERKPSAGIRKTDGKFHCFACGEIHELYEVISYCFGKDDPLGKFGWNWLLKNFATVQVEHRKPFNLNISRNKAGKKIEYVSEEELDGYRYTHPYWTERGITDNSIIELFDLGYSLKERMITFPNLDRYGNCLFVAKRSIDKKFFHYPNNAEKHVYGIYQLYHLEEFPKEVYIVESMIDCLLLWQYGRYACALNGLGNNIQFKELADMPCRKFILATDNDNAGIEARERIRRNVRGKIFVEVMLPAMKKDIGECTEYEIKHLVEVF